MFKRAFFFLAAFVCAQTAMAQPQSEAQVAAGNQCLPLTLDPHGTSPSGVYSVQMKSSDKRLVRIAAKVRTSGNQLLTYPEGASHVPEGWATYIRNLKAVDEQGRPVSLEAMGPGAWRLPDGFKGRQLALAYEVLLHHDSGETWPFGWDEAAYVKGDAVFFTGKALFITALDMQNIRVDFDLPKNWQVVTAWQAGCGDRSYRIRDAVELTESAHFTGAFTHRTLEAAGATIEIGLGNALAKSTPLMEGVIRASLTTAVDMLGPVPAQTFALIADLEPKYSGGGTFVRSVSMLFQEPPTASNQDDWGHIVTHELLHLWLGGAIQPAADQEYWFTEGFTDYLANLVQLRSGLITEQRFWKRVREHHVKYIGQAGRLSLRDAGSNKGANYDLVYSGGFLAALAMDVEMRKRSRGSRGVPDLVRALNSEFGGRARFGPNDVLRLANQLTRSDLGSFMRDYVLGTKLLPIDRVLRAVGISLDPNAQLMSSQSRSSSSLREALLR